MMKYGIVILNYQKYEMTENCVKSLLRLGLDANILIVDNASQNESFTYLKKKFDGVNNVEVIQNMTNAGYAKGNNYGFRYLFSKYPDMHYCCVMNPDVFICYKEIFDHLIYKLEIDESFGMATGLMVTNKVLNLNSCFWSIPKGKEIALGHSVLFRNHNNYLISDENGIAKVEVIPGSFFMIKRKVFDKLGGFDEGTFLYNEENILAIQLKELGYSSILSINDYFCHNHPKGERKDLKQKLISRKIGNASRRYLCRKYYPKRYKILLEAVIASNVIVISCKHLMGNCLLLLKGKK